MLYINPENKSVLFFPIHTDIQVNHLHCGQACQTGVLLERWQSLAAKLDTFHILFFFSTILWIPFDIGFFQQRESLDSFTRVARWELTLRKLN